MSAVDKGSQNIYFDYKQALTGEGFNKVLFGMQSFGIYEGFELTRVNDTTVSVGPGVLYIRDINGELLTKVETTASFEQTVSTALPYIVARFEWLNVENNFCDFLSVSWSTDRENEVLATKIQKYDIILGKCEFISTVLQTTFDYSQTEYSYKNLEEGKPYEFKVVPVEPNNKTVSISAGTAVINGNYVEFAGGTSASLTDTTSGRHDLIYIDVSGAIQIKYGVDAGSPVTPTFPTDGMVVAIVKRGSSRTTVRGTDIELIRPSRNSNTSIIETASGDWVLDSLLIGTSTNPGLGTVLHAAGSVSIGGNVIFSAANAVISQSTATSAQYISGGSASNLGANIVLFGQSHATNAGQFAIRNNGTNAYLLTSSGRHLFGGATDDGSFLIQAAGGVKASGTLWTNHYTSEESIVINHTDPATQGLKWKTNNVNRWIIYRTGDLEAGSDAGSNLAILPYADGGSAKTRAVTFFRDTGNITINGSSDAGLGKLHVVGAVSLTGNIITTATQTFIRPNTSDGTDNKSIIVSGGGATTLDVGRGGFVIASGNEYAGGSFNAGSVYLYAGNVANGVVSLGTGAGVERIAINQAGRILFGGATDDGVTTVQINGTVRINNNLAFDSGVADGVGVVFASSGYSNWSIDNYSGTLRFFYGSTVNQAITASGNVLIGTTIDPSTGKLHVQGAISCSSYLDMRSAEPVIRFYETDGATDGKLSRFVASSGNVYFQLTNDAYSSYSSGIIFHRTSGSYTVSHVSLPTGNVLVGTSTDPSLGKFHVAGNISTTGNIFLNSALIYNVTGNTGYVGMGGGSDGGVTTGAAIRLYGITHANTGTLALFSATSTGNVDIYSAGTVRFRQLGVGGRTLMGPTLPTDDGSSALYVNGTIRSAGNIIASGTLTGVTTITANGNLTIGAGSSDRDIYFAADATFGWNESSDYFYANKPLHLAVASNTNPALIMQSQYNNGSVYVTGGASESVKGVFLRFDSGGNNIDLRDRINEITGAGTFPAYGLWGTQPIAYITTSGPGTTVTFYDEGGASIFAVTASGTTANDVRLLILA